MISLYIGGSRSGKSGLAENEIIQLNQPTNYVATALNSASMRARILLHQNQRPSKWLTKEVPIALSEALSQENVADTCIIVDCLTLWLTNQLMADACLEDEIEQLCQTLVTMKANVVLVCTEVGQSLIPLDEMSQKFVCASGDMLQKIAHIANNVTFCQGGLSFLLKSTSDGEKVR